jgi:hypothetical protein
MENNQGSKKIQRLDEYEVSKMNILSAYMLGWITFGEALERLKNLKEDDNVVEFKKAQ